MNQTKILIIGAGIGQIPLIRQAKSRGLYVIVVTVPGDYPGIKAADECWFIDIFDKETIANKALAHGISAVISDQNDFAMPTVAYVAEKIGLPGNTTEQVYSYCDKNTFLDICTKVGVPTPHHIEMSEPICLPDDIPFSLPWIVKPSDAQSSIGVKKIDSISEYSDAVSFAISRSKSSRAILEEFFYGKEIVCEGIILNGKYYNLAFADRLYFNRSDILIPKQTLFPSEIEPSLLNQIVEYESRIADYVKPKFAIVHSEYLVDEQRKEIRIVESALRGGGVYISSDIIPLVTNFDLTNWLLDQALGIQYDLDPIIANLQNNSAGYMCFYLLDGVVSSINGIDSLETLSNVKMDYIHDIQINMHTKPLVNKGDRYGPILISAKNRLELDLVIKHIQDLLKIEVTNDKGITNGIVWG